MFRSKGIVLNIQKIRDNQIRIVLFTREYGKITCWSKKQISADIGCIISIFIERKGNQNLLKTHETLASAGDMFQKYDEVICFLQLLDSLNLMLPE